ncbi:MAG: 30S ribosomal protein S18 [Gemmatimonadetes bacterium]|nr:30S ribosomal protein S18 [Gemmatimonadota bacterium]
MPIRKPCRFCARDGGPVDYKDDRVLEKFLSDRGKILPRRATGNCAKCQRKVALAIKRARYLALLPYIRGYTD